MKNFIILALVIVVIYQQYKNHDMQRQEPLYFSPFFDIRSFKGECRIAKCVAYVSYQGKALAKPYRVITTKPAILDENTQLAMKCEMDILSRVVTCSSDLVPAVELDDKYFKNKDYDLRVAAKKIIYE